MKLNMVEINKLNPPGILELAGLVALIKRLISLAGKCGQANAASLHYARMIAQNTKLLRERHDFNTNLRIKAWVLQTAERRAWVRAVIGERRIARWQRDYDALARHELPPSQKRADKTSTQHKASAHPNKTPKPRKAYARKPFTLPRLADLFIMPFDFSKDTAIPTSTFNTISWSRPRKAAGRKPVIFWPSELVADNSLEPASNNDISNKESIPAPKSDAEPRDKKPCKTGKPLEQKPP